MKKYIPYTSLNISLKIPTTKKKKTNTIILKIISKLFTLQKKNPILPTKRSTKLITLPIKLLSSYFQFTIRKRNERGINFHSSTKNVSIPLQTPVDINSWAGN